MSYLPTADPPPPDPPATPQLAVSAGGGVFPMGESGMWGCRVDPDDPAVGVVSGRRGHVVVRRSGRIDPAGPEPPSSVPLPSGVRVVRPVGGRWWALHDRGATALDDGERVDVPEGAVDLVGDDRPVVVDAAGRARSLDGELVDDPGPLDGALLGAVAGTSGWWLVTRSGTILGRSGAPDHDPIDTSTYPHPLTAVGPAPDLAGLVVATADGRAHARGTPWPGGLPRAAPSGPIVGLSPVGGVRPT